MSSSFANNEAWVPNALFHLEDANQQQTQIFVSGLSFGLTIYSQQLVKRKMPQLFCPPGKGMVQSPVIYEILNARYAKKTIQADQATAAVFAGLIERFPCK